MIYSVVIIITSKEKSEKNHGRLVKLSFLFYLYSLLFLDGYGRPPTESTGSGRERKMTWEYRVRGPADGISQNWLNAHASEGWRFLGYIGGDYVFERRKPWPFPVQVGLSFTGVVACMLGMVWVLFRF